MSPLITTIARPPLCSIRFSVSSRQTSHCEYSRSATMLRIFTSPGVHSALVRVIRRQWFSFASFSSGGKYCIAWESPKRISVFVPSGSP